MNYIATVISNLSNGYIHLYWTGPLIFTSNGKCTGRCSIESKNDRGISSQVCILSRRYSFQAFQCDQHSTCWSSHDSEEMTDLRECIPYPLWQQITKG